VLFLFFFFRQLFQQFFIYSRSFDEFVDRQKTLGMTI
jgi:hypothetical protein